MRKRKNYTHSSLSTTPCNHVSKPINVLCVSCILISETEILQNLFTNELENGNAILT
jgi:hypothetical protein